jgi:hypothetical protein
MGTSTARLRPLHRCSPTWTRCRCNFVKVRVWKRQPPIRSFDPQLETDERWPQFAAPAVDAGVLGMLSFQLVIRGNAAGALNLFCRNKGSLTIETEAIGGMLAAHAAIALTADSSRQQLESSLADRDVIGAGEGRRHRTLPRRPGTRL